MHNYLNVNFLGLMKQAYLLIIFLLLLLPEAHGYKRGRGLVKKQPINEGSIILSGGPNYIYGDTQGNNLSRNLATNLTNYTLTAGFRYALPNNISFKSELSYADYSVFDEETIKKKTRSFEVDIERIGISARGEYSYFFGGSNRYRRSNRHSVYGFLGLGLSYCFYTAPDIKGIGYVPHLEPKTACLLLPYGVGYAYALSDDFKIGVEYTQKYSFTDKFDGYVRGNSNDVINILSLTVSYRLFGRKGYLSH